MWNVSSARANLALLLLVSSLGAGCDEKRARGEGARTEAEATVAREGGRVTIQLSKRADERIGISTAPVELRSIDSSRLFGGEVIVPPGRSAHIAAPFAGRVLGAKDDGELGAGSEVQRGDELLRLVPILAAEGRVTLASTRVEAAGQVEQARVDLAAAQVAFDRADELLRARSGSQRDVDDARARLDLARAALSAAESRLSLLERAEGSLSQPGAADLVIESPLDGVLIDITVAPGQIVPAGAPLLSIAALDRLWVRVPILGGDRTSLDLEADASVDLLGGRSNGPSSARKAARRAVAPPSADSLSATIDVFYEIDNSDHLFRPLERVEVRIDRCFSETLRRSARSDSYRRRWHRVGLCTERPAGVHAVARGRRSRPGCRFGRGARARA